MSSAEGKISSEGGGERRGGSGFWNADRLATLDTYFIRPFIQGLSWGVATNVAGLLISTLYFKSVGISVCASCGQREASKSTEDPKMLPR